MPAKGGEIKGESFGRKRMEDNDAANYSYFATLWWKRWNVFFYYAVFYGGGCYLCHTEEKANLRFHRVELFVSIIKECHKMCSKYKISLQTCPQAIF